jgi:hypoxanthine phosphoribosyltransferase
VLIQAAIFLAGVIISYLLSQPGLELLRRLRRQVSWRHFHHAVEETLRQIKAEGWRPDVIVGLNSGIVPASIIALNLRVDQLYFYDILPQYRGRNRINGTIRDKHINLSGKNVLVIDDQAYTGRSLESLVQHLTAHAAVDPDRLKRKALFVHASGAGPVELDLPSAFSIYGRVKKMPWVISEEIKPFWEDRSPKR